MLTNAIETLINKTNIIFLLESMEKLYIHLLKVKSFSFKS